MFYHNITHHDMLNGSGLRTVLWVSGCGHACPGCHNMQTWGAKSGIPFDTDAREELFTSISSPEVSGITFSGGDPLHPENKDAVLELIKDIKEQMPNKNVWLYTGYEYESIDRKYLEYVDVLVDGRFVLDKQSVKCMWRGSTNQRVIDVQKSIVSNDVVLYCE